MHPYTHEQLLQEHELLKQGLEKIAQHLMQAKTEILAISRPESETGTDKNIQHAATELEEVVRHTEEATNMIMDKADAIIKAATSVSDPALGAQINDDALNILETCSFQDITGQRIRKVLKTLEQTEMRLMKLIKLFGGQLPPLANIETLSTGTERPDEALMNGPQLGKDKPSQEDIDKLFSSL